jgi:hypothetical protein
VQGVQLTLDESVADSLDRGNEICGSIKAGKSVDRLTFRSKWNKLSSFNT